MPLGELLYESDVIAYDTVTKNYINPKDNSIYGQQPPTGGWPVTWYMDTATNAPIVVSGNQTAAQITAQLAAQNTTSTNATAQTAVTTNAVTNFFSGSTFGVSNVLLAGGVLVGAFLLMSKGGRR